MSTELSADSPDVAPPVAAGPVALERISLAAILIIAVALRIWALPARYEMRNTDESGYLRGSLNLLEGIAPAMKAAPAGPQTWIGWCYTAGCVAGRLISPGNAEREVPLQVRPFIALDHTLFELYRDPSSLRIAELWMALVLAVFAALAAFRIGIHRAGLPGGLLLGTLAAAMPMFLEYGGMARPYAMAWSFGIIAVRFAVAAQKHRVAWTCLFLGLAIASRIEMLILLPVVLWEFWWRPEPRSFFRTAACVVLLSAAASILFAPWLVTNLIGNLRAIATIRFADAPIKEPSIASKLIEILWTNALIVPALLVAVGLILPAPRRRAARAVIFLYALLLVPTTLRGGFGLHQHAPVFVVLLLISSLGLAALAHRNLRWARIASALGILLVAAQGVVLLASGRLKHVDDRTTDWIEQNVPAGAIIYVTNSLKNPLPTAASADRLWGELAALAAAEQKFRSGLARFNLHSSRIPRALSEENMIQDRGNRRAWYILGNPSYLPNVPRYDVRLIWTSPLFDLPDPAAAWKKTGGVLVWRDANAGKPPESLGAPAIRWQHPDYPVSIYVSNPRPNN